MNHRKQAVGKSIKAVLAAAFFLLLVFQIPGFAQTDKPNHWQALKGKHFLIHIQLNDAQSLFFGQKVLTEAERFYARTQTSLGHSTQDPWLWEKRCHINLYRDKQSYAAEAGRPAWSSASAHFGKVPMIDAYLGAEDFLKTELPHEIAHLLFREYVGVDNAQVPRWLDEGIALWNERSSRSSQLADLAQQKAKQGHLIPMAVLSSGNFKEIEASGAGWRQLAPAAPQESVALFYAESYSLVQFLVSRFGQPRFVEFIRSLKNGGTVEESLRKTYGIRFQSLSSFEKEWYRSLGFSKAS